MNMSIKNWRLPDYLTEELAKSLVPWRIEPGARHFKLFIGPQLVAILPKGTREHGGRGDRNTLAQIRRVIKGQSNV